MTKWKCHTCKKLKEEGKDPGIQCNLCNEWIGLECTSYSKEIFSLLTEKNIEVNFLCKNCKKTIPELRNLLEITKEQQRLKEDVANHEIRILKWEAEGKEMKKKLEEKNESIKEINNRLIALEAKTIDTKVVETIAKKCFNDADFPPLQEVKRNQEETTKKLEETIQSHKLKNEEGKRREENKNSLIVYGIRETHGDKTQQMKADFTIIKDLYKDKVDISGTDLLQVARLGYQNGDMIRPIKITFADLLKRTEILRNNKNLKLYGDDANKCEADFCDDADDHKHIYITPNKTKQERKEEKELREELTKRKVAEPDLIIRNGKIIKKSTIHARWVQIAQDGL